MLFRSVSEKMEFVLKTIAEKISVKFSELFATAASRAEVVCTFLALLELIRLKQLACVQPEPFAEIEVSKAVAPVAPMESTAPESGVPVEAKTVETKPEPVKEEIEETSDEDDEDEYDDEDDDDDEDEEDDGEENESDEADEEKSK